MLRHTAATWLGVMVAVTLLLALAPRTARAVQYEMLIDVDNEEDLQELFTTGQISEDTWNTLVQIMRRGVDLNRADREALYALPNLTYEDVDAILAYRQEAGVLNDPAALVPAGVLTAEQLLQIAPFLTVGEEFRPLSATNGRVRFQMVGSPADDRAPSMALQARVSTLRHLSLGLAMVTTRLRLGDLRYDPTRDALSAEGQRTRLHVPKFFVRWEGDHAEVLLGTFRAGFGQRLTFDNSDRFTPNGVYADDAVFWNPSMSTSCRDSTGELSASPCIGPEGQERVTSDLRWRNSLMGVAVGAEHLSLGEGWLQLYAFGSYQPQSIYQYEIYDRGRCDDPRNDGDAACAAPDIYRRRDDLLEPTSEFSFMTLDNVYAEALGGGNVSYFFNRRAHVGVTGYAAHSRFLTEGMDLDFQEWSPRPFGGGVYGAVGVDAAVGRGPWDLFLEVAHSFDDQLDGGGGIGAIARSTITWDRQELELTTRYYDEDFANPYARPIAAPDEQDGNRARDEVGGRVRYTGTVANVLNLRASADLWSRPSDRQLQLLAFVRADLAVGEVVNPGLWFQFQDKDLQSSGHTDVCYSTSTEDDENGEPIPCTGQQYQITARLRVALGRRYSLLAQVRHEWLDDGSTLFDNGMRQDSSAFLSFRGNPIDPLRFVLRVRFLDEDIQHRDRLEQSVWYYADVSYRFPVRLIMRLRYDVLHYLDTRPSTEGRSPNPEHWARIELQQSF
jgi:hypothetical protein